MKNRIIYNFLLPCLAKMLVVDIFVYLREVWLIGNKTRCLKDELFNMTRAWNKENI